MMSDEYKDFVREFSKEFNNSTYQRNICLINSDDSNKGVLLITFETYPKLSICCPYFDISSQCSRIGLWDVTLNAEIARSHMEDDVNLFTDDGLVGFGKLFAQAFMSDIDCSDASNHSSQFFPLRLSYSIGGHAYVGILKVPIVENDINPIVLNMMRALTSSCMKSHIPSNTSSGHGMSVKDFLSSQDVVSGVGGGKKRHKDGEGVDSCHTTGGAGAGDAGGVKGDEAVVTQPKKKVVQRAIGGVSLNPVRKKK